MERLRELVGMPEQEEYEEYGGYDQIPEDEYVDHYESDTPQSFSEPVQEFSSQPEPEQGLSMSANTNNVVGMPGTSRLWGSVNEVLVLEPRAFEEMPQVIQALRERKSVVLNLTMMEPAQAQRAVDFVAGATYTIDGHQERVGDSIFLFTPSCVQVSTQAGATQDSPQPQIRQPSTTAWQTDPQLNRIAQ